MVETLTSNVTSSSSTSVAPTDRQLGSSSALVGGLDWRIVVGVAVAACLLLTLLVVALVVCLLRRRRRRNVYVFFLKKNTNNDVRVWFVLIVSIVRSPPPAVPMSALDAHDGTTSAAAASPTTNEFAPPALGGQRGADYALLPTTMNGSDGGAQLPSMRGANYAMLPTVGGNSSGSSGGSLPSHSNYALIGAAARDGYDEMPSMRSGSLHASAEALTTEFRRANVERGTMLSLSQSSQRAHWVFL